MPEQVDWDTLDGYQALTAETAIYPDEIPEWVPHGLVYTVLGLNDEAGEVAGKLKKAIREDDREYLDRMPDELGDVLWYLARSCEELNTSMREVAEGNVDKLFDRKDRGVLHGEGDDR